MHEDLESILLTEEQIHTGVASLAERVTRVVAGEPFVAVSILKGSCIFLADLVRRIPGSLELAFACVESYRDGAVSGTFSVRMFPRKEEVLGKRVLLIDDILDSGRTLAAVRSELLALGARDVATCVLLDKPSRREVALEADFSCFQVEDVFLVGYGLDYAGRYRNLPYIGELRSELVAPEAGTSHG